MKTVLLAIILGMIVDAGCVDRLETEKTRTPGVVFVDAKATDAYRATELAAMPSPTPRPSPYDLALISFQCRTQADIGFYTCEGFVENLTSAPLENVVAVVTITDVNGTPFTSDDALIDYNPVLPGQQSPWEVIGTYNPAADKYRVAFKDLFSGTYVTRYD